MNTFISCLTCDHAARIPEMIVLEDSRIVKAFKQQFLPKHIYTLNCMSLNIIINLLTACTFTVIK